MLNTGNVVVPEKVFVKAYWRESFENMLNLTKKQLRRGKKKGKSFAVKLN